MTRVATCPLPVTVGRRRRSSSTRPSPNTSGSPKTRGVARRTAEPRRWNTTCTASAWTWCSWPRPPATSNGACGAISVPARSRSSGRHAASATPTPWGLRPPTSTVCPSNRERRRPLRRGVGPLRAPPERPLRDRRDLRPLAPPRLAHVGAHGLRRIRGHLLRLPALHQVRRPAAVRLPHAAGPRHTLAHPPPRHPHAHADVPATGGGHPGARPTPQRGPGGGCPDLGLLAQLFPA